MVNMEIDTATHREHQRTLCLILQEFDRVCRTLNIPYTFFSGTLLGAVRHHGFIPWDDDVDVMMLREDYDRFLREAEAVLDKERFFLQKEFSEHWPMFFSKLRMNNTTCLEKFHPKDTQMHQGIYMDIFPCDNVLSVPLGRQLQFCASKVVIAKSLDKRGYDTDNIWKKIFITCCRALPMKPFLELTKGGKGKSRFVHSFFGGASKYSKNIYPRHFFEKRIETEFEGEKYPISANYDELLKILYGDYMDLPPQEERVIKQHAILIDFENSYEIYQNYRDGMEFDVFTRSIR